MTPVRMSAKTFLVLMTAIAVVTDSMLHPFYPQYFARVFGVTDARQVGTYIAACSLTVLLAFPLWALLSRRVHALHLLVVTQIATALLSLASGAVTSLLWFWALSLTMMVFKASYLLIYPYVMGLEAKENHVGAISLLAFTVYFGNILAALLSGALFEWVDARFLFVAMAVGDALQTLLCLWLLAAPPPAPAAEGVPRKQEPERTAPAPPPFFVFKLGAVMLLMYFSAYLTDPFFTTYWEERSGIRNKLVTGLVFAIPGLAASIGLYINSKKADEDHNPYSGILVAVGVAILSLWIQSSGPPYAVLLGRFFYGLALFQGMVRLDALLFRYSAPGDYSVDFSKANLFQGLGVLTASFAAGNLVSSFGPQATFYWAIGGFVLGCLLYRWLFRGEISPPRPQPTAKLSPVPAEEVLT